MVKDYDWEECQQLEKVDLISYVPIKNESQVLMSKEEQVEENTNANKWEQKTDHGIMVFGTDKMWKHIWKITQKYLALWNDTGRMIEIPESKWQKIELKENWENMNKKLGSKPYPASSKDKKLINQEFNKQHT
ncbi:hypothetical protein MMC20_007571 [Loxospora ochrophaea]|nr:hypothetical protein [Loxospora ochrophaea]